VRTKTGIKTDTELMRGLVSGLRTAARRPNIYGYDPHEKQLSFHTSSARGRLFIGGNRSGKTVGGACEAIYWATGKHPFLRTPEPPTYGRVVSVDFLNGVEKIVRPEIARWLPASELKGGSWETAYDKELRVLTLENGSTLEFMSYDQALEKFAGTSRHWIWFDEEPPQDIFTECLLRLLDTGGSWWITMTPVEGMTWTFDNIYESAKLDPNLFVVEVDTTMNPHLNPGEIDILLTGLSEDDKTARLHGKYVQRGGLIYKHFSKTNVVNPLNPQDLLQAGWMLFNGMDHGFNNPTAWLWAAVCPDGRIVIYDEHYRSGEIVKFHAEAVHIKNSELGIVPSYCVGDPSIRNTDPITGTSVLLEYMEFGIPILLGNNDVNAGINRVARLIGHPPTTPNQLFVTKNCVNLLWEMTRYRWATWAIKRHDFEKNKKEEPNKKDDHAMDALRYLVASRPQVEDQSIPEKSDGHGYPAAVNPYAGVTDPGVTTPTRREPTDYTLGEEW
jgi:phage terminase large subunit-like protein